MRDQLHAMFDALKRADPILGGVAPWVAVALLLATTVLVSREERPRARASVWFLLGHFVAVGALAALPSDSPAEGSLRLLATALLMASVARSSFLLFVHSFWMRRFARPIPKILRDVIQAMIFIIAFLVVLRSAGVEPASLLTTSALLTAVVGLSLQDTLGNLFAGLAIQAQRPFTVGDWVQLDGQQKLIGRVVEINWRATRVITLERLEITFPNGAVAKSSITNFSRPTSLVRREIELQAPYEVSPQFVRRVLLSGMNHVHEVLTEPPPQIFTQEFSERGVCYTIRYFIDQFQDCEIIDSTVRERMWYAMERANLNIPVPRRQIDLRQTQPDVLEPTEDASGSTVRLFEQVSLFASLPSEGLKELAAKARRKLYTSEEVIVRQGDCTTEMYVLESGHVRIEVRDASGTVQLVGRLGRGDFFGELSLMTGEVRTADVVAEQEAMVLVLDRETVQPLLEKHPELAEYMGRILADRRVRLDSLRVEGAAPADPVEGQELEILGRLRRFFTN